MNSSGETRIRTWLIGSALALVAAVMGAAWLLRLGESGPLGGVTSASVGRAEVQERPLEGRTSAARFPQAQKQETLQAECAFFLEWAGRDCSPSAVRALIEGIEPFDEDHLACLPLDWLLLFLLVHCEDSDLLSPAESECLALAVSSRMPEAEELSDTVLAGWMRPDNLRCLIEAALPFDCSEAEAAKIWARFLSVAFAGRGSVFGASEEVLEAMRVLMAEWPLRQDSWWASLWGELEGNPPTRLSLPVRMAIIDVLFERLPRDEWILRLDKLASIGDARGELGSSTLMGMGVCLAKHLSDEDFTALLVEPVGDSIRRALLLRFPESMAWPNPGHGNVDPAVLASLRELRDSESFPHRLDIVQNQWRLLGPVEAFIDFERYAYGTVPHDNEWSFEGALRIHTTLKAIREHRAMSDDGLFAIEQTQALLRDWMISMSSSDLRQVATDLSTWFWDTDLGSVGDLRQLLRDVLGAAEYEALPPDVRAMLGGP